METPPGGSPRSSPPLFLFTFFTLFRDCLLIDLRFANQDAIVELSEHGVVFIVEETGCLQAKVYLQREVPDFNISFLFLFGQTGSFGT